MNKKTALENVLSHFLRMKNNQTLATIIFEEADHKRHGIGNTEAKRILLDVAIEELKRQLSEL